MKKTLSWAEENVNGVWADEALELVIFSFLRKKRINTTEMKVGIQMLSYNTHVERIKCKEPSPTS